MRQVQRDGVEWAYARYLAGRNRRGVLQGWAVALATEGRQAELVPVELPSVASRSLVWERVGRIEVGPATAALMIVGLLEGSTRGGRRWPVGTG